MTIIEAVKIILTDEPNGLTSQEIYTKIVDRDLYVFGAQNPIGVVNGIIRRRCVGIDFPSAHAIKIFTLGLPKGKKSRYILAKPEMHLTSQPTEIVPTHQDELSPEEKIGLALQEHNLILKQQLLDTILNQSPYFFEQLVVDMLYKLGYGYGRQTLTVTKGSRDSGIDGIISQDKLGLDMIYIQAKRNSPNNKVGRPELQSFVGAMEHIQKGVFITTAEFTNDARDYTQKQQQKNIKLIDGSLLMDLLLKCEVGISIAEQINIYKLDSDYFES